MINHHWISASQLRNSLRKLRNVHPYFGMTFLAFKEAKLPINTRVRLNFSAIMRQFLSKYYQPTEAYKGYYSPFRTSNPANRWLTAKYPSGSLQRITVDTFGEAIIHTKREPFWGWHQQYVEILARLQLKTDTFPIPAFDLAVWLYRNDPVTSVELLTHRLVSEFSITAEEKILFDFGNEQPLFEEELAKEKISERSLFQLIGWPPGHDENESMTIGRLVFQEVGPAKTLVYRPSKRLNLLTGDNSLGKTFLLDCIWWALTGKWIDYPAAPRRNVDRSRPTIRITFDTPLRSFQKIAKYNWGQHAWQVSKKPKKVGALSIYARHDGSFVVWDAVSTLSKDTGVSIADQVVLDRDSLWHGKRIRHDNRGTVSICNGVLLDWVNWQTRGSRFKEIFDAFVKCLEILSPPGGQKLEIDEPISMPGNEQEIPALMMEYGTVPIVHASAGVKRVIGIAYALIWAWFRHQRNARLSGRDPFDQLIFVVDEIDAHLHPRWQRAIVPALMKVVEILSDELFVQAHVASHSPLILASSETIFDRELDSLHHLEIGKEAVSVKLLEFANFGNVDAWLMSEVFGLKQARSLEAERFIEIAKSIQLSLAPNPIDVIETDKQLRKYLRDDDDFWPRWRYFAKSISSKNGD